MVFKVEMEPGIRARMAGVLYVSYERVMVNFLYQEMIKKYLITQLLFNIKKRFQ